MPAFPVDLSRFNLNYVDLIVVVWLIIGLLYGRKRGMTQELLPTIQWVAIVVVAGLFYQPLSAQIQQYAHFEPLWSNVSAYLLLGFGVHLVYLWVKHLLHHKLIGTDMFGKGEYYFGMLAGMVRFGCMVIMVCALMNSRIVTKAELAKTEKAQSDAFSDIRFPTYGTIQQAVLVESYSGSLIETNLHSVMIASVTPKPEVKTETLKQQQERLVNEIIDSHRR
ncbi:MAG TPA: CvpA family protein [Candidatus Baltobacteraceae bacterium]|nr:CvpA family protein [Candidatus Baltobacteraceae bacterium]